MYETIYVEYRTILTHRVECSDSNQYTAIPILFQPSKVLEQTSLFPDGSRPVFQNVLDPRNGMVIKNHSRSHTWKVRSLCFLEENSNDVGGNPFVLRRNMEPYCRRLSVHKQNSFDFQF